MSVPARSERLMNDLEQTLREGDLPPNVAARLRAWRPSRHPVALFVVRRTALGALTLVVVSILMLLGVEVLPGDDAPAVLGRNATPESVAVVRAELHLDRPAYVRYLKCMRGIAHGDLGVSAA